MREMDRGREREREIIWEYNLSANMFPNAGMAELYNRYKARNTDRHTYKQIDRKKQTDR
jgi:hypothetical protein